MKRIIKAVIYIAIASLAASCAKNEAAGPNDANKRYFDAWLKVNNINVKPSGLGIYVLEESEGKGREVTKDGYILMDYVTKDLDGKITSYTGMHTAQQLGEYVKSDYYGPQFVNSTEGYLYAGVSDMLIGMKVGGHKKAIVPSWLMSYKQYATESEYLKETPEQDALIYDVTIRDFTLDINAWEIDTIGRFFANDKILIEGRPALKVFMNEYGVQMQPQDSIVNGFYYKQLRAPIDTASFALDTTIYINYTGMTLDGRVFDTTDEKTAKDYNIYSASKTYEPVQINWSETEDDDYTGITMGTNDSSVIEGFAFTLWQMKAMEKGIGVFYSPLGYSYNGNGNSIPGYSPLIFIIDIVAAPEE